MVQVALQHQAALVVLEGQLHLVGHALQEDQLLHPSLQYQEGLHRQSFPFVLQGHLLQSDQLVQVSLADQYHLWVQKILDSPFDHVFL